MQRNKVSILSTKTLDDSLIQEAKGLNIEIDVLFFIQTEFIHSMEVEQEIQNAFQQSSTVVFTSMNALEAVTSELKGRQPDWRIYSAGGGTSKRAKKYFGEEAIAGTANSAAELAELIAEEGNNNEVIFFCGNKRRHEVPDILRKSDIEVNEIIVYETIGVAHSVEKQYHGILFFSPSAVESFFSNNKIVESTVLFAIGNTTANALKKYSNDMIITSDEPRKENLVKKMMEYFSRRVNRK